MAHSKDKTLREKQSSAVQWSQGGSDLYNEEATQPIHKRMEQNKRHNIRPGIRSSPATEGPWIFILKTRRCTLWTKRTDGLNGSQ